MFTSNQGVAMAPKALRMALLIDGDNAQLSLLGDIIGAVEKHGTATVRRAYGDWSAQNISRWKDSLLSHSIQPVQQFSNTPGKNASDIALVIDAMDLLHSGNIGGFCIASSDSDYTRLAMRIREQGLFVMGVGRSNTPTSFMNACNYFVTTETLSPVKQGRNTGEISTSKQINAAPKGKKKSNHPDWAVTVKRAVTAAAGKDGWADMAAVGSKLPSNFKSSKYGPSKLSKLIETEPDLFETQKFPSTIKVRVKS